ncbi:MAG TPA: GerMN domain-containing protein [Nitrospirota bacterium]|nr:GerMN domain-containing protein [Nitrospirota bacterium]
MSQTSDRSIRDNRLLFIIVIGIVLIVAGAFYIHSRMDSPDAARKPAGQDAYPLIQPAFRNEPLIVTLYFPLGGLLASGTAPVKRHPDTQAQARETIAAALQDRRAAQAPALGDIKLRAFYLDQRGTAYIDLAASSLPVRASAWDEQLAVYALVNTLVQNFEEIKQVAFLIDGRDAQTLAGHLDLSRKFTKRMDLVRQ